MINGYSEGEHETISYMHDAIISFLARSGIPPRLNGPALMLADATMCAMTDMDDEAVVEEFRKCLKQARLIQAEKERERARVQ